MKNGTIHFPENEPVPLRYLSESDLVQKQVDKNVAEFVTRAIWKEVTMDDMRMWGLAPSGELRPNHLPEVPFAMGRVIHDIIHQVLV